MYNKESKDQSLHRNPYVVLFLTTFIFFFITKSQENEKCTKNKLEVKHLISQSTFFSIVALFGHNIYEFFLEKQCIEQVNKFIIDVSKVTYIPEGLFVSGIVLLSNQISSSFYPKCS
jgi:hypothetical protein